MTILPKLGLSAYKALTIFIFIYMTTLPKHQTLLSDKENYRSIALTKFKALSFSTNSIKKLFLKRLP